MPAPEITGQLSIEQLLEIVRTFADYDLVESIDRAKKFIHASRVLLLPAVRRSSQANRGEEVEFEPEIIQKNLERAEAWLQSRLRARQPVRQYVPSPDWRDE